MRGWWVLFLCAPMGCASMGVYGAKPRLMQAFDAHAETLRWGGEKGLEGLENGRRVTSIRVRQVVFSKDQDRATVHVEVEGYELPRMTLRRWYIEEKWVDKTDGWVILSQRELKPKKVASRATR